MTKKELRLEGIVDVYGDADLFTSPIIGGQDVIGEIEKCWPHRKKVTVYLGAEPAREGPLWTSYGFAGTDVTPPESPMIEVGDFDLLKRLRDLDGRHVLLVIEEDVARQK